MDGWTDGRMDGCCVNKGGTGGCWVCWLLGGLPTQSKYQQHLGKTFGCLVCLFLVGYPPFFLTLLPLVGVLVGSACLACCLLGFGEDTFSDGWIMDREKMLLFGVLVCWFACRDCLRDTAFVSVRVLG